MARSNAQLITYSEQATGAGAVSTKPIFGEYGFTSMAIEITESATLVDPARAIAAR